MTVRFTPELAGIVPYEPGLPIEGVRREYGLDRVVKLASNEFPLPPFPEVQAVVAAALGGLQRYPDGFSTDLRVAAAGHYGRDPEQVTVGAGTCELLFLLTQAVLERGDEVVLAAPSFSCYGDVIAIRGAVPVAVPLRDFTHDLERMAAAVTPKTKLVFVCNPNNPTGTYLPSSEIRRFVEAVPSDVMVVLDEAYVEFVTAGDTQGSLRILDEHDNVVVLRTFSKIYGLCGLRTGLALCASEVREAVNKVRQPFNVNLLGQLAAIEALKHQDQVAERREINARLRSLLVGRLAERGRPTVPSESNFLLVGIEGLRVPQDQVCGELLRRGVILRDGNALGCPGWARVTVGTEEEIEFFLQKLAELEPGDEVRAASLTAGKEA
jgi:histidinol-phosphate aminotransferase